MSDADTLPGRIALARSILTHSAGYEARAVDEALLALQGATIDELAAMRAGRDES